MKTITFKVSDDEARLIRSLAKQQWTRGKLPAADAAAVLLGMIESVGTRHAFLADDQPSAVDWQDWCNSSAKSTDAHLARLAERHGFRLATFDGGIPGAFLIPVEGA